MFVNATFGDRLAQPEEMTYVVQFLLSDYASYVNGEIYTADNG